MPRAMKTGRSKKFRWDSGQGGELGVHAQQARSHHSQSLSQHGVAGLGLEVTDLGDTGGEGDWEVWGCPEEMGVTRPSGMVPSSHPSPWCLSPPSPWGANQAAPEPGDR